MFIVGALLLVLAVAALFVALGVLTPQTETLADAARRVRRGRGEVGFVENPSDLGRLRVLTGGRMLDKARRNIVLTGRRPGWTVRNLMLAKVVTATIAGLASLWYVSGDPGTSRIVLAVLLTGAAFVYPDVWLGSRANARQLQIERELPDVLDQTLIAIESGLSFEASLSRIVQHRSGPLADELNRTLQDMNLGMSRRAAYAGLSDRTSIEDLRRFCKQVTQAEEFGVSIASVVRNLAKEMRLRRRYRAEELAQKIPVKIIAPLAVCFLPVLFVIVLYPSLSGLMEALG